MILGCDAAEIEMRAPGDWLYSPETGERLRVAGVLEGLNRIRLLGPDSMSDIEQQSS